MACGLFTIELKAHVEIPRRKRGAAAATIGRTRMPSESSFQAGIGDVAVRPFTAKDQPLLARVAHRMHPGQTASPRDPAALDRFFSDLGDGNFMTKPGAQAFVATI